MNSVHEAKKKTFFFSRLDSYRVIKIEEEEEDILLVFYIFPLRLSIVREALISNRIVYMLYSPAL
jgi:hypothetical protein